MGMSEASNPRFVWLIGSLPEVFPDVPSNLPGTVLYDRQGKRSVLTLHLGYENLFCLEHVQHGHPLTDLENWINRLSGSDLESEINQNGDALDLLTPELLTSLEITLQIATPESE